MAKPGRPGAAKGKKGPTKGTGGHGRKSLEGKGPTPKAEDRPYHKAYKAKQAKERAASKPKKGQYVASSRGTSKAGGNEVLSGRNSVVEALRARIPATGMFIAQRIEMDDRIKEAMAIANHRGIPIAEVTRAEIDRMTGGDFVHQGIALQIPPYRYLDPNELLDRAMSQSTLPLLVALDGITDPRNLGAIIRSAAAFGANGIVLPQRRSVGVTASAWKTSAGAAARLPVALASNLNQVIAEYKRRGLFVIGLDAGGDVELPAFDLTDKPLLVIVGSEGKGLSRLVTENCDQVVSIPISSDT
ncbi:MAG: 23S rRNA (guanosine(2251)-2'-O)-methyltransferase RlmB, partial [Aquiluna sp.]